MLSSDGDSEAVVIIDSSEMPYALAVEDLNQDGGMDVIVGHVEASTAVLLNAGGTGQFSAIQLDDNDGTAYGFDMADLDGDGQLDIVIAKSGARNRIIFGSRASNRRLAQLRALRAILREWF